MKRIVGVISLVLAMATIAFGNNGEKPFDQGHEMDNNLFPSAYTHQACILTGTSDAFISASFIYWEAIEGSSDLGHSFPIDQTKENNGVVKNMFFKYKPGFKVAAGTTVGHDNWLLSGEYTWLHFSTSRDVVVDPEFYNLAESNYYDHAVYEIYAKWTCRYDMADIEMSRPFYMGTNLVFKPFASLRGGCINQYYSGTNYRHIDDPIEDYFNNTQKTWLIGPRIGMDCDWIFCNYFRLISNVATALFYQNFKNKVALSYVSEDDGEAGDIYFERVLQDKTGQLTPNLEGALGLGWGDYFGDNNNWHFDLSLLYEVHYFFNQNKMRPLNERAVQELLISYVRGDYEYSPAYKADDLMLHGLTLTARVDF